MYKDKNIKVLIPARLGSKGVVKKNIKMLAGKPLISHTIAQALKIFRSKNIYLSSDGDDILKEGSKFGINLIKRPDNISQDDSTSSQLIKHFIYQFKNLENNFTLILLQPTSPLRKASHIREAFNVFIKTKKGSIISVAESKQTPYKSLSLNSYGELINTLEFQSETNNRQEFPRTFYPNGAIYIFNSEDFLKENSIPLPRRPYIMGYSESIDIDDELDFKLAELLLEKESGF